MSDTLRLRSSFESRLPALVVVATLAGYSLAVLPVMHHFMAGVLAQRVLIALLLVAPPGFAMGFCFPVGLRWLKIFGEGKRFALDVGVKWRCRNSGLFYRDRTFDGNMSIATCAFGPARPVIFSLRLCCRGGLNRHMRWRVTQLTLRGESIPLGQHDPVHLLQETAPFASSFVLLVTPCEAK